MGFGLFGKLPQKRDFVSVGLPHTILHPWETWLQQAVAASRSEIGRGWEDWYLVAPIWHFWVGKDVFGTNCAGSLMASVDQVGRYFPLTIMYVAEGSEQLPPPLLDGMTDWYRQIDERLLAVLAEEREIEIGAVVAGLAPPRPGAPAPISVGLPSSLGPTAPGSPGPLIETPSAVAAVAAATAAAARPPAAPEPAVAAEAGAAKTSPWDDLPSMSADALSALRQTTGAVVEPPRDPTVPPVAVKAPAEAAPAAEASAWDAPADAAPPAAAAEPEPAGAAPAEPVAAAAAEPPPVKPETPDTTPEPQLAPARIQSGEFKGGLLLAVEPHRRIAEAAGDLLDRDYRQATMARSYWWCETTPTGSPLIHSRQGLPDPYFFTRMLMWVKQ